MQQSTPTQLKLNTKPSSSPAPIRPKPVSSEDFKNSPRKASGDARMKAALSLTAARGVLSALATISADKDAPPIPASTVRSLSALIVKEIEAVQQLLETGVLVSAQAEEFKKQKKRREGE